MKKLPLALMLILLLLGTGVFAQEEEEGRDILEVAIASGVSIPSSGLSNWNDSLGAKTGWNLGLDVGYFATSSTVIGLNFIYSQHSVDTESGAKEMKHRFFAPMVYVKRYFQSESDLVPYVKVQAGLISPKFATVVVDNNAPTPNKFRELSFDPTFGFGGGIGAFLYTSDYSGLFLEVDYRYAASEDATGTYQGVDQLYGEKTGLLDIRAGIKVFFGSDE